jgi:hypothetical protein
MQGNETVLLQSDGSDWLLVAMVRKQRNRFPYVDASPGLARLELRGTQLKTENKGTPLRRMFRKVGKPIGVTMPL